jgi:sulfate adenylyltransferase
MSDDEEYLISYCNIKSGLIKYQKDFANKNIIEKFYQNPYMGFPICLPVGIKYFDYKNSIFFKIDNKKFSKKIFNTDNLDYVGNSKFFRYGNIFASNVLLKKKYIEKYKFYIKNFDFIKKKIGQFKKKNKKICSMQIRNAPHFGHEAIFKFLIKRFDILVLNPIFGIKKKNDFNNKIISLSLKFMEKKYPKIIFLPLWSSFHYAGPREALHHMNLREKLNFDFFYIGRDHAGAQNIYKVDAASKLSKIYKDKFIIKSITSRGGYYCKKCKDYVIKGTCRHNDLLNISGTEFRLSLKNNKKYVHADKKLQNLIING